MVLHSFIHVIALYRMVSHGIAMLASARGLYLARHLSTSELADICMRLVTKKLVKEVESGWLRVLDKVSSKLEWLKVLSLK